MEKVKLTDLMPIEEWVAIEEEFNQRFGLNASVFDTEGIRITDFKKWANDLCPAVKADEKGQSYICSVAHQNLATEARKSRKPVVGECDAGLLKLVVPIFLDDSFLGVIGGCGLLADGSEVETFLVGKTTDLEDEDIINLSGGIGRFTPSDERSAITYLERKRDWVLETYRASRLTRSETG